MLLFPRNAGTRRVLLLPQGSAIEIRLFVAGLTLRRNRAE
jgi:hypothetical protein